MKHKRGKFLYRFVRNSPLFDGKVLKTIDGVLGLILGLELQNGKSNAAAPDHSDRVHFVLAHQLLEVAHLMIIHLNQ